MMDEIVIYKTPDEQIALDVQFEDETVWLTQKQMAELFIKNVMTINEHLKNIYKEQELNSNSTLRKSLIVQNEGNRTVSREIFFII